jgi:hypothetical protein
MSKLDLRKELKRFYSAKKKPEVIDAPSGKFLTIVARAKEHPREEITMRATPARSSVLGLYVMLSAARKGDTTIPASEAAVTNCPTIPTVVPKVSASSMRMNPIRMPAGRVESWETKREGIRSLFP